MAPKHLRKRLASALARKTLRKRPESRTRIIDDSCFEVWDEAALAYKESQIFCTSFRQHLVKRHFRTYDVFAVRTSALTMDSWAMGRAESVAGAAATQGLWNIERYKVEF